MNLPIIIATLSLLVLSSECSRCLLSCPEDENGNIDFLKCLLKNTVKDKREIKNNYLRRPTCLKCETEEERQDRIDRNFDRFVHFINVMGQFDQFVTEKATNVVKTINDIVDTDEKA